MVGTIQQVSGQEIPATEKETMLRGLNDPKHAMHFAEMQGQYQQFIIWNELLSVLSVMEAISTRTVTKVSKWVMEEALKILSMHVRVLYKEVILCRTFCWTRKEQQKSWQEVSSQ